MSLEVHGIKMECKLTAYVSNNDPKQKNCVIHNTRKVLESYYRGLDVEYIVKDDPLRPRHFGTDGIRLVAELECVSDGDVDDIERTSYTSHFTYTTLPAETLRSAFRNLQIDASANQGHLIKFLDTKDIKDQDRKDVLGFLSAMLFGSNEAAAIL